MIETRTVEGRLVLYFFVWNAFLAFGLLLIILKYKLHVVNYFPEPISWLKVDNTIRFLSEQWKGILLGAVFIVIYFAVTLEQKIGFSIAKKLFVPPNVPTNWMKFRGRQPFVNILIANIILFLTLAWSIDNIVYFSATMFIFYAVSIVATSKSKSVALSYLSDPKYSVRADNIYRNFVERRRAAIRTFYSHPHVIKVSVRRHLES